MTVAQKLARYMSTTGKTVTALADEIGVSRPNLSNVLNGRVSLSIELALTLQKKFNLNARQLLHQQLDEQIEETRRASR